MKTKYYHTSGTKFKVGDIIGGPGKLVCLTTSPVPHGTIQNIVKGGFSCYEDYFKASIEARHKHWDAVQKWIDEGEQGDRPSLDYIKNSKPVKLVVYEMNPFAPPAWIGVNDEFRAYDIFVEVVRVVGSAEGILKNHIRKWGESSKAWHFGSKAIRRR